MKWQVLSLFSGIECFREAINIIQSAIAERFGIHLGICYDLMVSQPFSRLFWFILSQYWPLAHLFVISYLTPLLNNSKIGPRWRKTGLARPFSKSTSRPHASVGTSLTCWSPSLKRCGPHRSWNWQTIFGVKTIVGSNLTNKLCFWRSDCNGFLNILLSGALFIFIWSVNMFTYLLAPWVWGANFPLTKIQS